MIGYIYAVISSIFFGLYVVPKKLSKQSPVYFGLFVGLGFFVSSVILYLLKQSTESLLNPVLLYSVVAGVLWALGLVLLLKAIDAIGLARSNQWKNLQGPIGVVLSLVILSEFLQTNFLFAILAGGAIFISALFLTISSHENKAQNRAGVNYALLSAVFFGATTVINKFVTDHSGVYAQQIIWSLAITLSIALYILFSGKARGPKSIKRRDAILGLSGGLLYLGASYFMLSAYLFIPASIGFTIIQLNTLWVVGIGIFYFKEIDYKKYATRINLGLLFAIIGVLLLALAKK